ncbi:MAG: dethiobiotin synthase [Solirubrobacteraceae bacterium]|jgi:dethiobiotin synthetase
MGRACFVTATDTDVGKTVLASTIVAALRERGLAVRARKPVATGVLVSAARHEPGVEDDLSELADHELLAAVSGEDPAAVAGTRFEPAASPHLAAELAGVRIDVAAIAAALRAEAGRAEGLVVEGIGGLLVPLADGWDVARLAAELDLPVIVAARCGLGTINHTLLTLEAARARGLDIRAVVLTPWPPVPSAIEESNRRTIAALGGVEVALLPALARLTRASLAAAGADLPYERWLAT